MNGDATQALIRDVQYHPVSDAPEHVDFQRLAPGEPIRVSVPVHFENDGLSPGLKRGGVLNVIRHTVQVYAMPEHIPEQFTANLANLDFNDAVRWEDLGGTENTRPAVARNFVVATVAPPTKQAEVAVEADRSDGNHGCRWPPPLRQRHRRAAARHGGADPQGITMPCCSGSASAIRSRGWPGTGITSVSWRSIRLPSGMALRPGGSASGGW